MTARSQSFYGWGIPPGLSIAILAGSRGDRPRAWGTIAVLGQLLPNNDNRVTLADETDGWGIPVAKVTFGLYDNDKKLIAFARKKVAARRTAD